MPASAVECRRLVDFGRSPCRRARPLVLLLNGQLERFRGRAHNADQRGSTPRPVNKGAMERPDPLPWEPPKGLGYWMVPEDCQSPPADTAHVSTQTAGMTPQGWERTGVNALGAI